MPDKKQRLHKFLERGGVLEQYIVNIRNEYPTKSEDAIFERMTDLLIAFPWLTTPEGEGFWNKLNEKFCNEEWGRS